MNKEIILEIKGMHCPDCPAKVERTISKMDGVSDIKVDLENENGSVTFNNTLTGITAIINRINKMGFEAKTAQKN